VSGGVFDGVGLARTLGAVRRRVVEDGQRNVVAGDERHRAECGAGAGRVHGVGERHFARLEHRLVRPQLGELVHLLVHVEGHQLGVDTFVVQPSHRVHYGARRSITVHCQCNVRLTKKYGKPSDLKYNFYRAVTQMYKKDKIIKEFPIPNLKVFYY